MKEHLIKQKNENKILSYTHRIILGVLIAIFIYEFAFIYSKEKYNFLTFEQVNLFINIFYYLLCVIKELNKKDTKKFYQKYFHLCFSLSASVPFVSLIIYLISSDNSESKGESSTIYNIVFLISPIIVNVLETLIIKRYKPEYINPIMLIVFLMAYHGLIHFFGKMGMDIGNFSAENLQQFMLVVKLFIYTTIGSFAGWWLYKVMTKPKIKKINLGSSTDTNELSDD